MKNKTNQEPNSSKNIEELASFIWMMSMFMLNLYIKHKAIYIQRDENDIPPREAKYAYLNGRLTKGDEDIISNMNLAPKVLAKVLDGYNITVDDPRLMHIVKLNVTKSPSRIKQHFKRR